MEERVSTVEETPWRSERDILPRVMVYVIAVGRPGIVGEEDVQRKELGLNT